MKTWLQKYRSRIVVLLLAACAPLLMAPTGGVPSRPVFQVWTLRQTFPQAIWIDSDGTANNRRFDQVANAGCISDRVVDDAASAAVTWMQACRTLNVVDTVNLTATAVQANGSAVLTVAGRAGVSATANATTVFASGGLSAVALAAEQFDTGNFHDLVTNNSRVILPATTGYASCSGTVSITSGNSVASSGHDVRLTLRKNGTDYVANQLNQLFIVSAGSSFNFSLTASNPMIPANGTDYVELVVSATNFSTNNTVNANNLTNSTATTRLTCAAV